MTVQAGGRQASRDPVIAAHSSDRICRRQVGHSRTSNCCGGSLNQLHGGVCRLHMPPVRHQVFHGNLINDLPPIKPVTALALSIRAASALWRRLRQIQETRCGRYRSISKQAVHTSVCDAFHGCIVATFAVARRVQSQMPPVVPFTGSSEARWRQCHRLCSGQVAGP